jgi:hypothetical protein
LRVITELHGYTHTFRHEFEVDDERFYKFIRPFKRSNDEDIRAWASMTVPRDGAYSSLALLPPRKVLVYVLADYNEFITSEIISQMRYIGVYLREGDVVINYIDSDETIHTSYVDTVIIWQPQFVQEVQNVNKIKILLKQYMKKNLTPLSLIVGAVALGTIMKCAPDEWKTLFPDAPEFDFTTRHTTIETKWCEPSEGLLPAKEDLLAIAIEDPGRLYHRIPFFFRDKSAEKKCSHIAKTNDEIIFCAAYENSQLAVFNFDLVFTHKDVIEFLNISRKKQCAECILSLMSITRSQCPPIIE